MQFLKDMPLAISEKVHPMWILKASIQGQGKNLSGKAHLQEVWEYVTKFQNW